MLGPKDFVGLYAIIPTPATADAEAWDAVDTVDLVETERLVNALITDGTNGLIILGTTGEAATLTHPEYEAFVDCTLSTVRGRVPTFVGTSALGLHEVVSRTRFAHELGADGILVGLPMWQPCTVDTAVEFYRALSTGFPDTALMVYGNSRAFRFDFAPEFWGKLVDAAPTVTAAKFARPKDFPAAKEAAKGRVHFLPHEAAVMKFYELSPETTTACWSTAASMGPEPALAIMRAINGGRIDEARAIATDLAWAGRAVEDLVAQPELFAAYNIQVEKTRIASAGYCKPGPIRPPYQVFPEEYAALSRENGRRWKEIRAKYAALGRPAGR
jgi:trans-o-hydroxybenzylidenepyruvate hydratase-aldolase